MRRGRIRIVDNDVGDVSKATVDDDQDTDHLGRLADPMVLKRVERIVEEQRGQRYGDRSG